MKKLLPPLAKLVGSPSHLGPYGRSFSHAGRINQKRKLKVGLVDFVKAMAIPERGQRNCCSLFVLYRQTKKPLHHRRHDHVISTMIIEKHRSQEVAFNFTKFENNRPIGHHAEGPCRVLPRCGFCSAVAHAFHSEAEALLAVFRHRTGACCSAARAWGFSAMPEVSPQKTLVLGGSLHIGTRTSLQSQTPTPGQGKSRKTGQGRDGFHTKSFRWLDSDSGLIPWAGGTALQQPG